MSSGGGGPEFKSCRRSESRIEKLSELEVSPLKVSGGSPVHLRSKHQELVGKTLWVKKEKMFMDVQTYPKRFLPEPFEAYWVLTESYWVLLSATESYWVRVGIASGRFVHPWYMHNYVYIYMYMRIYIYICIYVHAYVYTHTGTWSRLLGH